MANNVKLEELFKKAVMIAEEAHDGQVDKAGMPYILHPVRVSQNCTTIKEKIVALLHDTIEDTYVTPNYLREQGFTEELIEGILSVTKQDGEDYYDFVKRAAENPLGKAVKTADLMDNLDIKRLSSVNAGDLERINRYLWSYRYLTGME